MLLNASSIHNQNTNGNYRASFSSESNIKGSDISILQRNSIPAFFFYVFHSHLVSHALPPLSLSREKKKDGAPSGIVSFNLIPWYAIKRNLVGEIRLVDLAKSLDRVIQDLVPRDIAGIF